MSSGSGEHYCYDTPKNNPTERVCEIANTPGGRSTYYLHRPGWDVGDLGRMYNPVYFNYGVAVHGLSNVPDYRRPRTAASASRCTSPSTSPRSCTRATRST